jgi:hypothetical protein
MCCRGGRRTGRSRLLGCTTGALKRRLRRSCSLAAGLTRRNLMASEGVDGSEGRHQFRQTGRLFAQ